MRQTKRLLRKWATRIVNEELPEEATCWINDADFVSYKDNIYYVNHEPVSRAVARDTILHILYGKCAKRSFFTGSYDNLYW